MLVAKIFVNHDQIDEIWIHNIVKLNAKGETLYEIRKPEGYETVKVWHKRELGYNPLLEKVLRIIQ